ncbi:MAG: carboxyltransferase domain-containing protein [Pseudomonadota bacterium]
MSKASLAILPLGQDGIVVRFSLYPAPEIAGAVQMFFHEAVRLTIPGIVEIAPGLTSVLLRFDPAKISRAEAMRAMRRLALAVPDETVSPPLPRRRWTIPAAFGGRYGPDLENAAQAAGMTVRAAVTDLTSTELRVLAIGFAPGQPYLGLLPKHWDFPRQAHLTPRVPAGAIVAAVRQLVLFSSDSATGWRQVGQAAFRPFQPQADTPFPLRPGDALRFAAVDHGTFETLEASGTDGGGACCEML